MITNAVFLDAGYLYKMGASLAFSGHDVNRSEISMDVGMFSEHLADLLADAYPDDDHLRTYWYDGAPPATELSTEHRKVAFQPSVKLRLGTINKAGIQKGVDSLIIRDLMTLSQERSIQRAIVITGDEDLGEGIEYAQDRGVRVTLLVFPDRSGQTPEVANRLRAICDEVIQMTPEIFTQCMSRRMPAGSPPISTPAPTQEVSIETYVALDNAAEEFGRRSARKVTSDQEVAAILRDTSKIPQQFDGGLLRYVADAVGVTTLTIDQKRLAREGFWAGFTAEVEGRETSA